MSILRQVADVPWASPFQHATVGAVPGGRRMMSASPSAGGSLEADHAGPIPLSRVQDRLVGFDLLRVIAACLVMVAHAVRSPEGEHMGLKLPGMAGSALLNIFAGFLLVVIFCRGERREHPWKFAWSKFARLYGAFLLWSVLYALARVPNYLLLGKESMLLHPEWLDMFMHGTTYHLWFLPYLTCVTLLSLPLVVFATATPTRATMTGGVLLLVAIVAVSVMDVTGWTSSAEATQGIGRILARSPRFLCGIAMGLWFTAGVLPRVSRTIAIVGALCFIPAVYVTAQPDGLRLIASTLAALAGVVVALYPFRGSWTKIVTRLGPLCFGVYLCHVLFNEAFITLYTHAGIKPTLLIDAAVFVCVAALSFALAAAMRGVRRLRWLTP